jgi:hypothetical protein
LILAGIALTAGSMVANNVAQGQIDNARSEVLATEARRQSGFNREVEQLNTQSQDRYVGFEPQQEQRATELADMFASDVTDPNSVMPGSSSNIVNKETDAQIGAAQGYVDQQSGALADMRAFGDMLGSNSLLQARDASKVGQIGGFKQGSQGIVPYELDDAGKSGDGMKMFADVLRLAGTTMTGAGIGGGGGSIADMFGKGSTGFVPGMTGPSLGLPANIYYGA